MNDAAREILTVQENRRGDIHDRVVPIARAQEALLRFDYRNVQYLDKIDRWKYRSVVY